MFNTRWLSPMHPVRRRIKKMMLGSFHPPRFATKGGSHGSSRPPQINPQQQKLLLPKFRVHISRKRQADQESTDWTLIQITDGSRSRVDQAVEASSRVGGGERGSRRSAVPVAASAAVQVLRRMPVASGSARRAAKVRAERKRGAQQRCGAPSRRPFSCSPGQGSVGPSRTLRTHHVIS